MIDDVKKGTLSSRVIETRHLNWREFQFLQPDNFKYLPAEAKTKLRVSILKNDFTQPFYVWQEVATGIIYCLDGYHRVQVLKELTAGGTEVPLLLPATFINCSSKQDAAQLVLVYSSIYAKITHEGLLDFMQMHELDYEEFKMHVDLPEFDNIGFETGLKFDSVTNINQAKASLQERFIVPPFSILDTRQGYWQERKKKWHALGFDSQETREEVELVAKSGQGTAIYELRNMMRELLGREPDWDQIISEAKKRGMHLYEGASIFDPVLCEILYTWFCPAGGSILDAFAGGSVRGIVASLLSLQYTGIDLRADQVTANEAQASSICSTGRMPVWIAGNSKKVLPDLPVDSIADFVFSCPPYHDLERYSDDPEDLSNMSYDDFLCDYREIIMHSVQRLKPNRFACFVVGDIRDKNGAYRDFVGDTVQAFRDAGMQYYNEIILVNVAGSLPIRVGRQFANFRKVGKTHQNVLVFFKGDPKKIKDDFPLLEAEEVDHEMQMVAEL